jgi:hypothetical protein
MVHSQQNYYGFKSWITVACSRNTNGYLYEHPPLFENYDDSLYSTQTNEELAKFLYECDLSDTRKELNRRLYWEKIRNEIEYEKDLKFWGWLMGQEYADKIVDDYIERHNLLGKDEYSIWRKPIIRYVPAEKFLWAIDSDYLSMVSLNEVVLKAYASTCDILVMGTEMSNQFVITKNRHPTYNFYSDGKPVKFSQIFGGVSEKFLQKFPNYLNLRFDLEKSHVCTFESQRSSISTKSNNFGRDEETFEYMLLNKKMDYAATQKHLKNSSPAQPNYSQIDYSNY